MSIINALLAGSTPISTSPGPTCPITENGFVHIIGHVSYPSGPASTKVARQMLLGLTSRIPRHRFVPDRLSTCDSAAVPELESVTSKQVTNLYLLSLAVSYGGRFLTLDRNVPLDQVPGGRQSCEQLI